MPASAVCQAACIQAVTQLDDAHTLGDNPTDSSYREQGELSAAGQRAQFCRRCHAILCRMILR
jgi:hypothetical protein